jgi:hypothetical protein
LIENSARKIAYCFLLALHVGLVWLVPYLPTQDGPSHVYNLFILHDLLNGGKEWGNYFTYHVHAVPNLGFEAVAYPLLDFFPPLITEKIFVSVYVIIMGIVIPLFLRTFGRSSLPLAYLMFPAIFNFTLLMGFYSYALAVVLCLLGVSVVWKVRERTAGCKFIIYNVCGCMIFYAHLIPFVFFLLALLAITLAETGTTRKLFGNLLKLSIILSPSLLNFLYYLAQGKGHMMTRQISRTGFDYLIKDLFFFSTVAFSIWQVVPAFILLFLVALGSYMSLKYYCRNRENFTESSPEKKTLVIFLAMLTLIYFLAPFRFGGGSYFNERLPWVILLVMLPLLYYPETAQRKNFLTIAGFAVAVAFWFCNLAVFTQQGKMVGAYLRGLQAGLPERAFVMTYKTKAPEWSRIDVLMHAAAYYGILGGCVDAGNYEAALPYFPVHFRPEIGTLPSSDLIDYKPTTINWLDYPTVQYLIGWDIDIRNKAKLNKFFSVLWSDGPVSIWQKRNNLY